jgi:hypothetical protein
MKVPVVIFLCAVTLMAAAGCNQRTDNQTTTAPAATETVKPLAQPTPAPEVKPATQKDDAKPVTKAAGTLSEEEIGKLLSKWQDPKTGQDWAFSASFANVKPKPAKDSKVTPADADKISYRITSRAICIKEVNGKKTASLVTDGSCTFYITDSSGNVVTEPRTESLKKLCPS